MKSRQLMCVSAMIVFAALAVPIQLAAQDTRYKLIDLGTFGGPASYLTDPGNGRSILVLNNQGMVAGRASTSTPDPGAPNACSDSDCFLPHAFQQRRQTLQVECHKSVIVFGSERSKTKQNQSTRGPRKRWTLHI